MLSGRETSLCCTLRYFANAQYDGYLMLSEKKKATIRLDKKYFVKKVDNKIFVNSSYLFVEIRRGLTFSKASRNSNQRKALSQDQHKRNTS